MEIEASIAELQATLRKHRDKLATEEAAKTTLVLPFLRALGYNIFDPDEVVPEFTSDVGTKKGEKVDYGICVGGEVKILVECKPANGDLSIKHASQLYRYFAATDARLALLTNGIVYRFFTDAEKANMMDDRPFFTFDLDNYKTSDLRTLATFQRADFDLDRIVSHAGALKLQSEVLAELRNEFEEPSDDLVKIVAGRLHDGIITKAVRERFRSAITHAYGSLIRDGVHQRLEKAISGEADEPEQDLREVDKSEIDTTEVEIEGFNIIRAICAEKVNPSRVFMRDAKSYCAILLDDNNRRTIARMHFNSPTSRHLGLFSGKTETRESVAGPVEIFNHRRAILKSVVELEEE
ncbi:MAG: type I restriction endonuclease [Erythrobacter sp.]